VTRHIVIAAFSARRGGGKTYLLNLLKSFPTSTNLKVTMLVSKNYEIENIPATINVKVVYFPVDNPLLRVIWESMILPFLLRYQRVDVFFCPGGTIPFTVRKGPWQTVTMFRNMIPFDLKQRKQYPLGYMRIRNWFLAKIMLKSMESADLVIFISKYARKIIEDLSKKGIKKSVIISHGISKEFLLINKSNLKRPNYLPTESYIVYPSIIDVYKSQKEIVLAISILYNRGIDPPTLLLAGEIYGKYGRQVRNLIKELRLENKIILSGPFPFKNMPFLYHFSEFVIFASQSENCPNILLEAMAAKRAILCSKMMPMPEFGVDAVEYFDPNCPEEIADKIEIILKNSELKHQLENRAGARAVNYNWEESARLTWDTLESLKKG
jgi:glycosyltransferase involved in cell wall biosynthesis